MKHADHLPARTTGESQLQVCYEGDAPDHSLDHLPWGKPIKYDCLVGGGLSEGQGLGGSAGSCQCHTMHHGLSTRGRGGTTTRPASPATFGPDRVTAAEKSRVFLQPRQNKRWNGGDLRSRCGRTRREKLLGSSVVGHPNAWSRWREFWCAWPRSRAPDTGRYFLVAGPRRVHLKPKVHSSRLFVYSWKELSLVIFIKSLSVRISLKSLSLARATRGYRTSVRNPLGGVPSKRTICVICF